MWIFRPINKGCLSFITQVINHLNRGQIGAPFSSYRDYDSMIRDVDVKVPTKFNFAKDIIDKHANDRGLGDKIAFYYVSKNEKITKWSFKELSKQSKIYANSLRSFAVINRAILILPKVPEWWILNIAAIRNGTVLMPVSFGFVRMLFFDGR